MAFSFLAYRFSFWRYLRFCIISDDVVRGSTKASQRSIENNSRNIKAVLRKIKTLLWLKLYKNMYNVF